MIFAVLQLPIINVASGQVPLPQLCRGMASNQVAWPSHWVCRQLASWEQFSWQIISLQPCLGLTDARLGMLSAPRDQEAPTQELIQVHEVLLLRPLESIAH